LTIKSTSHTFDATFSKRFTYLCFVCPSIFSCQRSRLPQQSTKPLRFC